MLLIVRKDTEYLKDGIWQVARTPCFREVHRKCYYGFLTMFSRFTKRPSKIKYLKTLRTTATCDVGLHKSMAFQNLNFY